MRSGAGPHLVVEMGLRSDIDSKKVGTNETRVVGHFPATRRLGMFMMRQCRRGSSVDGPEGRHGENGMRVSRRGGGLVLRALTALALVVAPYHLSIHGPVAATAYAGKGGNGGGNNGNGNGNGGSNGNSNSGNGNSGGNSGGSNSGNGNSGSGDGGNGGNSSGGNNGNSGNSNGNGNSGNSNGDGNSGNSNGNGNTDGNSNSGGTSSPSSAGAAASNSLGGVDNHVTVATGDKVEVSGNKIEVTHRNGMKERVENGRFRMEDKYGRTIVDRKATVADLNRLKNL